MAYPITKKLSLVQVLNARLFRGVRARFVGLAGDREE
jgi:hypothetical protein